MPQEALRAATTAAFVQVTELVTTLMCCHNVQSALENSTDPADLVKAINRRTGSHDSLAPALTVALQAIETFCQALEPEALATVIVEQHQDLIIQVAQHAAAEAVVGGCQEGLNQKTSQSSLMQENTSRLIQSIAESRVLTESTHQLAATNVTTPPEALLNSLKERCDEILDALRH
eukprot:Protomagalhaensia_sp_Gyna_25__5750@NODE_830_length_2540_cov_177_557377_g654_i0_p2_GENE_NODE_830_length_2540_cov_177_557377_g654_i0NODE_830_length_2540_cov_177_557377_g654_i0_p2_ORF_typecomplete_len186_score48_71COG5/PF10392_9/0_039CbiQ/PF02361_16/0_9CbiQ/PF02361_16/6e02EccE/PF11203_8/6_5e03EccE/PF11203_8/0_31_NODE_830_length_2540_cov_177_557377_g654_i019832510